MDASSAARRLSLTLAHFPSVCTGNETYLSASYWHVVATTLDALTAAYLYIGATGCTAPRIHANVATATAIDTIRLFMTRNTENVNDSSDPPSSYGLVIMRSWRMPYTRSDPTTPTTQPTRHPAGMAPSRWRPPGDAVAFHAAAYAASTSVESYPPPSTPRRKSPSHNAVCERRDSMMMIQ